MIVALFALLLAEGPVAVRLTDALVTAVEKAVAEMMAASGAPGLSVAVAQGGELRYVKGFGHADVENQVVASPALQLAETGRLDLDADVRRYVPGFPVKPWPITARQLPTSAASATTRRVSSDTMRRAARRSARTPAASRACSRASTSSSTTRRQVTKTGRAIGCGLGWDVSERKGRREIWHTGAQARVSNVLYVHPTSGSWSQSSPISRARAHGPSHRKSLILCGPSATTGVSGVAG